MIFMQNHKSIKYKARLHSILRSTYQNLVSQSLGLYETDFWFFMQKTQEYKTQGSLLVQILDH